MTDKNPQHTASVLEKISALKPAEKCHEIKGLQGDENNAHALLHLAQNEKSYFKEAALQGLATTNLQEAEPIFKKLLKSKSKGEKILLHGTSDIVSDLVAVEIEKFFKKLFQNENGYHFSPEEFRKLESYAYKPEEFLAFQVHHSLILGKASEKIQEIYRLFAENNEKFASFGIKWVINEHFNFYEKEISAENLRKIFPQTLALSIIRNPDERLISLANELAEKYGKNWLTPQVVASFLTEKSAAVFEKFSPLLLTENKTYILDALALMYFSQGTKKYTMVARWGNYHDERNDTTTYFKREILEPLDERWLEILTEIKAEKIPLQAYFSMSAGVAVSYENYDQMLQALLPKSFENQRIKEKLVEYFIQREKAENGASLYIDALNLLGVKISKEMILKWIAYKPEAVSKHNIPIMLNHNTDWTEEEKQNFLKENGK